MQTFAATHWPILLLVLALALLGMTTLAHHNYTRAEQLRADRDQAIRDGQGVYRQGYEDGLQIGLARGQGEGELSYDKGYEKGWTDALASELEQISDGARRCAAA